MFKVRSSMDEPDRDIVRADRRVRPIVWVVLLIGAVAGTAAVWWIRSSLDELTELARTDRVAAIELFRRRVLPPFVVVVFVGVAAGALMLRQGLQVLRAGEYPPAGMRMLHDTPRQRGRTAKVIGMVLAFTGFLLAALPLAILSLTLWLLRQQ